ncbi:uncharacterized protein MELLADRAFT_102650 [Melampsora larici-populina 98AG31]|uniref:RING-type domain-containing protein n=1 Tax=Melampsora larici-populina (strain 98AG31 / pathotype 3-4-7) TaxID=747676 RepID=F4R8Y4_MELLP|nr:uncharacterized protein MELLADRAFT_102650 [Melampsora larici-populina 98AG31]EGG11249.1 hypothetical protein MELLADRAFT_102650 [Melampsora larici-populina 98AG31]
MTKIFFSWWCYLIFTCSSWALTPSESLTEGAIEVEDMNLLGGVQMEHGNAIRHLTAPTNPDSHEEENLLERRINFIRSHGSESECVEDILNETVKALEIWSPIHESVESKTRPGTSILEITHKFTNLFTRRMRKYKIFYLARDGQTYNSAIRTIARELDIMIRDSLFGGSSVDNCLHIEIVLIAVLEYLQRDNLKTYERLWTLSVLRLLQSLLPMGHVKSISQDPNTGRVCRGGLELFLTQGALMLSSGMDLEPKVKGVSYGRIDILPVDKYLTEALERAELILNIRNYLQGSQESLQTPGLIGIHNKLLQNRSLFEAGIIESLSLQALAMDGSIDKYTSDGAIHCLYQILQHLDRFYSGSQQLAITEALKRVELMLEIRKNLHYHDHQIPAIMKMYDKSLHTRSLANTRFIKSLTFQCIHHVIHETTPDEEIPGLHSVKLEYIKACLHLCHIQDSALKGGKGDLYGLDVSKGEKYLENQDFFIDMMYRSSTYIDGLQDYLHSQVKKDEPSGHYQYISKPLVENQTKGSEGCPICLSKFLEGQRVVKLKCLTPHIFHEQCINRLEGILTNENHGRKGTGITHLKKRAQLMLYTSNISIKASLSIISNAASISPKQPWDHQ